MALTRSVPKPLKQLLKEQMGLRATPLVSSTPPHPQGHSRELASAWLGSAVNLLEEGPCPDRFDPPSNPVCGHPGDLPVS